MNRTVPDTHQFDREIVGKLDGKVAVITGGSKRSGRHRQTRRTVRRGVALFLASDDSSYVNGLELVADGGTTAI